MEKKFRFDQIAAEEEKDFTDDEFTEEPTEKKSHKRKGRRHSTRNTQELNLAAQKEESNESYNQPASIATDPESEPKKLKNKIQTESEFKNQYDTRQDQRDLKNIKTFRAEQAYRIKRDTQKRANAEVAAAHLQGESDDSIQQPIIRKTEKDTGLDNLIIKARKTSEAKSHKKPHAHISKVEAKQRVRHAAHSAIQETINKVIRTIPPVKVNAPEVKPMPEAKEEEKVVRRGNVPLKVLNKKVVKLPITADIKKPQVEPAPEIDDLLEQARTMTMAQRPEEITLPTPEPVVTENTLDPITGLISLNELSKYLSSETDLKALKQNLRTRKIQRASLSRDIKSQMKGDVLGPHQYSLNQLEASLNEQDKALELINARIKEISEMPESPVVPTPAEPLEQAFAITTPTKPQEITRDQVDLEKDEEQVWGNTADSNSETKLNIEGLRAKYGVQEVADPNAETKVGGGNIAPELEQVEEEVVVDIASVNDIETLQQELEKCGVAILGYQKMQEEAADSIRSKEIGDDIIIEYGRYRDIQNRAKELGYRLNLDEKTNKAMAEELPKGILTPRPQPAQQNLEQMVAEATPKGTVLEQINELRNELRVIGKDGKEKILTERDERILRKRLPKSIEHYTEAAAKLRQKGNIQAAEEAVRIRDDQRKALSNLERIEQARIAQRLEQKPESRNPIVAAASGIKKFFTMFGRKVPPPLPKPKNNPTEEIK